MLPHKLVMLLHTQNRMLNDLSTQKFMISIDREFDEGLLPWISEVHFDDELNHVASAPDVGNYLISEVNFVKVDGLMLQIDSL